MATTTPEVVTTLFKTLRSDGTCWLFLLLRNDCWAITCDGRRILMGGGNPASLRSGVERYLSLVTVRGGQSTPAVSASAE